MLTTFNWDQMPFGTRYGTDPSALIRLQRGMSASEYLEGDDFPIQSRAFRFGKIGLVEEVTRLVNQGDGIGLLDLSSQQTIEGYARHNGVDTPFISAAMPDSHADWHARKHPDGIIVDLEVPATSIVVPWMMENSRGEPPYEVHLVGAIPAANIVSVTKV